MPRRDVKVLVCSACTAPAMRMGGAVWRRASCILSQPSCDPIRRPAWNKGRIVGQKHPLLSQHVWAFPIRPGRG